MANYNADLVVMGGNAPGLFTAMAAADMGKTAIVLEPSNHIGGMLTGGLSHGDWGRNPVTWGITKDAWVAVGQLETPPRTAGSQARDSPPRFWASVINSMLAARPGVTVLTGKQLASIKKTGTAINWLMDQNGDTYSAPNFGEATYEGDLLAMAGCSYSLGMDSAATWGNLDDGFNVAGQKPHSWGVQELSTGRIGKFNQMPFDPGVSSGMAQYRIQAMNWRLCLTTASNRVLFSTPPTGYDDSQYPEWISFVTRNPSAAFLAAFAFSPQGDLPESKADANIMDLPVGIDEYINASYAQRAALYERAYCYTRGLLYFCQNRAHLYSGNTTFEDSAKLWGLCADEFQTDYYGEPGWSPILYPREGRRLIGQYVLRMADTTTDIDKSTAIARFQYEFDSHINRRVPGPTTGQSLLEGELAADAKVRAAYPNNRPIGAVPWESVLPHAGQVSNLAVPWNISAERVVFSAYRMERHAMQVGESVGYAAALCATKGIEFSKLSYADLRTVLDSKAALLAGVAGN